MRAFARNYAGLFSGRHGRTGPLSEGRCTSCLVASSNYFLACSRYLELHPVYAWMVAQPGEYPWSSYGANAVGKFEPWLSADPEYLAPGPDPEARVAAYRGLFSEGLLDELVREIRSYLRQQNVSRTDRFRSWVEARTGRFAAVRPAGASAGSAK